MKVLVVVEEEEARNDVFSVFNVLKENDNTKTLVAPHHGIQRV